MEFNERVLLDPFQVTDATGKTWWLVAILDTATDYMVVDLLKKHTQENFWKVFEKVFSFWEGVRKGVWKDDGFWGGV